MKYLLVLTLLSGLYLNAQKPLTAVKITYERISNGKPSGQEDVIVYANANRNWITSPDIEDRKAGYPREHQIVEPLLGKYLQVASLSPAETVTTADSVSLGKQQFELTDKRKKILGYDCRMAKTVINSNRIEVWYTDAGIKAGPSVLGQLLGMVLEIDRNGNYQTRASKIEKLKKLPEGLSVPNQKPLDMLSYRDRVWKSRFVRVPLFEGAQVNFDPEMKPTAELLRLSDGMTLVKRVRIPEIPGNSQLFVDVSEQSLGDAYDRTGHLFVIPSDDLEATWKALSEKGKLPQSKSSIVRLENEESPLVELMHYITPFGVGKYNYLEQKDRKWQDSVYYRMEISDLIPMLSGKEILVGVTIGNYDKGGHKVNANLSIHRGDGIALPGNNISEPVFNNVGIGNSGRDYNQEFSSETGSQAVFFLEKPLKNARLRYITTGHGGWENGDEFVPKTNTILIDNRQVFSFTPWRTDCGSYRLSNPASGNFENGLSSSDYSRANWCPGVATNPIWIDLGDLAAGQHTISIKIPVGKPEGGSSSSWSVSVVLEGTTE